jgi:UDP-glucose 4-epimerase
MVIEDHFTNKKVLITGGLGFIGSNLARRLVALGAQVLLVDTLLPEQGGNFFNIDGIEEKVRVNIANIQNEMAMRVLVRGQDTIFNLAGSLSHTGSMEDPYWDLENNCRGHLSLLEACKKANRDAKIVFGGTRSQYGKVEYLPVDEGHVMRPRDINGVHNVATEAYHFLYHACYDIRATSLRITNTFGPRQQMKHSRQGFINWFTRLAMDGKEITIFGEGKQLRDYNYVDDVVEALLRAAASPTADGNVFNLGCHKPLSVRTIAELVIKIAGSGTLTFQPFPHDAQTIEVGDFYADFTAIRKALGWEPQVDMEEGLERTIEFYRRHKEHYWA